MFWWLCLNIHTDQMTMISWNCQGLGYPLTVHHLKDLIKSSQPIMVFFMETKQVEASCERLRRMVNMDNSTYVLSMGSSGGLGLWWSK